MGILLLFWLEGVKEDELTTTALRDCSEFAIGVKAKEEVAPNTRAVATADALNFMMNDTRTTKRRSLVVCVFFRSVAKVKKQTKSASSRVSADEGCRWFIFGRWKTHGA
jgi:hypothetical protein